MHPVWIVVIVLLIVALLGAPGLGVWQHSYGYGPSGIVTVILVILVVLLLLGKL